MYVIFPSKENFCWFTLLIKTNLMLFCLFMLLLLLFNFRVGIQKWEQWGITTFHKNIITCFYCQSVSRRLQNTTYYIYLLFFTYVISFYLIEQNYQNCIKVKNWSFYCFMIQLHWLKFLSLGPNHVPFLCGEPLCLLTEMFVHKVCIGNCTVYGIHCGEIFSFL